MVKIKHMRTKSKLWLYNQKLQINVNTYWLRFSLTFSLLFSTYFMFYSFWILVKKWFTWKNTVVVSKSVKQNSKQQLGSSAPTYNLPIKITNCRIHWRIWRYTVHYAYRCLFQWEISQIKLNIFIIPLSTFSYRSSSLSIVCSRYSLKKCITRHVLRVR